MPITRSWQKELNRDEPVTPCLGGCGKPIIGGGRCTKCFIKWVRENQAAKETK